ncbi:hypothetical protein HDU98_008893 [Podochytrium sp. JEL0797]|nr:hypothetical protein HDU98_008893 [Podochytrium sp. JEL0797]
MHAFELAAAGTLVFFSTLWILLHKTARTKGSPPVAANGFPIIGHLLAVMKGTRVFFPLAFEGKDCDIVEANVLGKIIYVVRGSAVRSIFTNSQLNKRYADPEALKQVNLFAKGILFNAHLESWKYNRKLLIESLGRPRFIRTLAPKINEYMGPVYTLLDQLDESNTPLLANVLFGSISLDVIIDIVFSNKRQAAESYLSGLLDTHQPPDQILTLIHGYFEAIMFFLTAPPIVYNYVPGAIGIAAKHRQTTHDLDALLMDMVQQKSVELESNTSLSNSDEDLASILCQSKSPTWLHDSLEVVKEAVIGGTDTSSNTMAFMVYELAKNPDIANQVCQEIEDVVGLSGALDVDALDKLPLLEATIHETLRMHSPAQFVIRELTQDVVVGDVVLKKGEEVWVAIQMTQVSLAMWEDPLVFCPSRFLESKGLGGPLGQGFAHMPFGAGVRKCPGESLALMEMKLVMANLIRRYKFVLVDPSAPLMVKETTALGCLDLPVFLQRRV